MMKPFKPPKRKSDYPDRDIDCQEAIEAEFQKLVQNIAAAGWGPSEIAEAIENLAIADKMAREENAKMDAAVMLSRLKLASYFGGVQPAAQPRKRNGTR